MQSDSYTSSPLAGEASFDRAADKALAAAAAAGASAGGAPVESPAPADPIAATPPAAADIVPVPDGADAGVTGAAEDDADIVPTPDKEPVASASVRAPNTDAADAAAEAVAMAATPPSPLRPSTAGGEPLHARPWGANVHPSELAARRHQQQQRRRPQSAGPSTSDSSRAYAGPSEPLGMTAAQQRALKAALEKAPSSWTVEEVLLWLEHVGFRQYRRTFAHNCVDGIVLLSLTPEQLRVDLRIDSLGHRAKLAQAIAEMTGAVPGSAKLSRARAGAQPSREQAIADAAAALEHVHVEEERHRKLDRELSKALVRCNRCRDDAERAQEMLRIAEQEVQRLASALGISEAKLKTRRLKVPNVRLGESGWRPVGDANKGRRKYDAGLSVPAQLCTFQPYVSAKSKQLMSEQEAVSFEDRLKRDELVRKQRESGRRRFYTEQDRGGAEALKKSANKRERFLREEIRSRCGEGNDKWAFSKEELFDKGLEANSGSLGLSDSDIQVILKTKGGVEGKRKALEGAMQARAFLDRLANDASVRKIKQREREDHIMSLEGRGSSDRQRRTEERRAEAKKRLQGDFGWQYPTVKEWARGLEGPANEMSKRINAAVEEARKRGAAALSGDAAELERADSAALAWARQAGRAAPEAAAPEGTSADAREAAMQSRTKHIHGALVLLSAMTPAELDRLAAAEGEKQAFIFNQALRRQAFVWRQQKDFGERRIKVERIVKEHGPRGACARAFARVRVAAASAARTRSKPRGPFSVMSPMLTGARARTITELPAGRPIALSSG